jgi:hypothetical protein
MYNIHMSKGLRLLADMLAQLKEHGVCWISPTCSTWIWLNRGTNCRGIDTGQEVLLKFQLFGGLYNKKAL